jgi:hypothetical protein
MAISLSRLYLSLLTSVVDVCVIERRACRTVSHARLFRCGCAGISICFFEARVRHYAVIPRVCTSLFSSRSRHQRQEIPNFPAGRISRLTFSKPNPNWNISTHEHCLLNRALRHLRLISLVNCPIYTMNVFVRVSNTRVGTSRHPHTARSAGSFADPAVPTAASLARRSAGQRKYKRATASRPN